MVLRLAGGGNPHITVIILGRKEIFYVDAWKTFKVLKNWIFDRTGVPEERQILSCEGHPLTDGNIFHIPYLHIHK